MAEVTNELMYEVLKSIQHDVHGLKDGLRELKQELISLRGHVLSIQNDIHNMYGILARHDERLDRIEHRLELRELAEAQRPYDPT
jgi:predicted  nucleic acid-binding Zn-ribbon protein